MRYREVLACLLTACWVIDPAAATPQEADAGGGNISAEIIESIPAEALWSALQPVFIRSKGGAVIGVWQFDKEHTPIKDGWTSPAFLMAGLGGLAEKPVALQIWTRSSNRFLEEASLSASRRGAEAAALFGSGDTVRLKISVTLHGVVLVDGRPAGRVTLAVD